MDAADLARTLHDLDPGATPPATGTAAARRAADLRDVPLGDLTLGDLRLLMSEGVGLPWVVPLALDAVAADLSATGDLYPGDLFDTIGRLDVGFWLSHPDLRARFARLQERAFDAYA